MKAVILAGGFGTRLSEETGVRPKPMVEIGGRPIIWHIMKIYSAHGIDDFVIAAGYKSHLLKEYFASYYLRSADVTFDLAENSITTHSTNAESWRVTIVETGDDAMTGGRIKRLAPYLDDDAFCLTYGDCLARHRRDQARLVPPGGGRGGDPDCHPAPRALRRARATRERREDRELPREAVRRRRLGERRLLRSQPERARVHRRRLDGVGAGAPGATGERGQARRLPARGLLAEHGQPAGQDGAGGAVGLRRRPWKVW